eukprot:1144606-Pelagomonas_calceolata.AAC.2
MPSEWCACTSILLRLQGFLPAQHAPAHNQPGNGAGAPPVLLFTCCSVFTHLNSVATMHANALPIMVSDWLRCSRILCCKWFEAEMEWQHNAA